MKFILLLLFLFPSLFAGQYVYHMCRYKAVGQWLIPLTEMAGRPEFAEVYNHALIKIGFTPKNAYYYKIPIEVLMGKRVTVWKFPLDSDRYDSSDAYCDLDFSNYQEMEGLPEETKEYYKSNFDPANPSLYPRYHFYAIPHVLCQDPIDLSDPRITIINAADAITQ